MTAPDDRPGSVTGETTDDRGDRAEVLQEVAVERRDRVTELVDELDDLVETVDDPEDRERVKEAMELAADLQSPGLGNVIVGFDRTDLAEAFLGSLVFGIPMFVEGGTQEVGAYVATHPLFLLGTVGAAVALVVGIIYVAEFQDVRVHDPLFGVVPRRLVGVLGVAFVTALAAMTAWGRVDWSAPWLALCTVTVAYVPMSLGAALGDILPGS